MNRSDVKAELLAVAGQVKACPLCHVRMGIRYHEIIYIPEHDREKYSDQITALADAIFVPELGILLCDQCNAYIGSGHAAAEKLLAIKLTDPDWDPRDVLEALRKVAKLLKRPEQWMPRTMTVTYTIFDTYTILVKGVNHD
jgi:hypothetical protein